LDYRMTITIDGTNGITTPGLTNSGPLAGTTGTFSGLISANGGQIKFPASQNASSDANTLDDYEEGTWTPTAPVSLVVTNAFYQKIGNTVYLNVFVNVSSNSSSSGMIINGLPYAQTGTASVGCFNASGTPLFAYMDSGGIVIRDASNNTKVCSTFSGSFLAFELAYKVA